MVRKLFYMGLGLGLDISRTRQAGRRPSTVALSSYRFFNKVVFSKIRERLGGRLRYAVSGAAPLGRDLANFYSAVGMTLITVTVSP